MNKKDKPLAGEIYYDEDDETMYIWDGDGWRVIGRATPDQIKDHKMKILEKKYKRAMKLM